MTRTYAIAVFVIGAWANAGCSRTAKSPEPSSNKPPAPPKILQFYASPPKITAGEQVTMCYGVENAETVIVSPERREIAPSQNRCFSVSPEKSTVYQLTAIGSGGEASAQLGIEVLPPAATLSASSSSGASPISLVVASANAVSKGQIVTICYGVTDVASVRVDPPVRELQPKSSCFAFPLLETTTFTITAVDHENKEHKRQVTVRIK